MIRDILTLAIEAFGRLPDDAGEIFLLPFALTLLVSPILFAWIVSMIILGIFRLFKRLLARFLNG